MIQIIDIKKMYMWEQSKEMIQEWFSDDNRGYIVRDIAES